MRCAPQSVEFKCRQSVPKILVAGGQIESDVLRFRNCYAILVHQAALRADVSILEALKTYGANFEAECSKCQTTLMAATMGGNPKNIAILRAPRC